LIVISTGASAIGLRGIEPISPSAFLCHELSGSAYTRLCENDGAVYGGSEEPQYSRRTSDCSEEFLDAEDRDHPLDVVGEHVQRHFGGHVP
jgi:hypothetical protein